jgi:glycosyltransferase involved in cell wall biosynthesis
LSRDAGLQYSLQPASVPVSVLIPVKNEARNIDACLATVRWASEVIVVDSASDDGTPEMAVRAGARVVQFKYRPGGPRKKNWAIRNVAFANDWILILDADERIPGELAAEIAQAVENPEDRVGFYLNRRFNFLGTWIRHAGYFPSWNLRLFRAGKAIYETVSDDTTRTGDNEVHEHMILDGPAGHLGRPMDHYAYPTLADFVEKHTRYAYWEARVGQEPSEYRGDATPMSRALLARRAMKQAARQFPCPHWVRFVYHFFLKRGFLDGTAGYIFCHLLAEYEFLIWARRREMRALERAGANGR